VINGSEEERGGCVFYRLSLIECFEDQSKWKLDIEQQQLTTFTVAWGFRRITFKVYTFCLKQKKVFKNWKKSFMR